MSEAKHQCCGRVRRAGSYRLHDCSNNASLEFEGEWYCKTHHPPTIKAKGAEKSRQREAAWQARRAREKADAAAATEQKRRADAYDQLVERVKELEGALQQMVDFFQPHAWGSSENKKDALDDARAALSKSISTGDGHD